MAHAPLSELHDWHLVHPEQDIRGWKVVDASNETLGHVSELLVSTDSELVEVIRLDNGKEYAAKDIELGDRVVHVRGAKSAANAADQDSFVKVYGDARVQRRATGSAATGATSTSAEGFDTYHSDFETHYGANFGALGQPFTYYEPAYQYGYTSAFNDTYRDRDYGSLEPDLRRDYETQHGEGTWDKFKDAVKHGFDRGSQHHRTRRTTT